MRFTDQKSSAIGIFDDRCSRVWMPPLPGARDKFEARRLCYMNVSNIVTAAVALFCSLCTLYIVFSLFVLFCAICI